MHAVEEHDLPIVGDLGKLVEMSEDLALDSVLVVVDEVEGELPLVASDNLGARLKVLNDAAKVDEFARLDAWCVDGCTQLKSSFAGHGLSDSADGFWTSCHLSESCVLMVAMSCSEIGDDCDDCGDESEVMKVKCASKSLPEMRV